MGGINCVFLLGRLTRDPELRLNCGGQKLDRRDLFGPPTEGLSLRRRPRRRHLRRGQDGHTPHAAGRGLAVRPGYALEIFRSSPAAHLTASSAGMP